MRNRNSLLTALIVLGAFAAGQAEGEPIQLPAPKTEGGMPLMQALKARQSTRSFSDKKLTDQTLSNLLWAAFGVNRSESGKRTAPSARNWQEIDIYVLVAEGVYIYDAVNHALIPVLDKDVRALAGTQDFVKSAPLNLVYVADFERMGEAAAEQKVFYSAADTGFIGQNVYLFCASEGLGCVMRGLIDKSELAQALGLKADQRVILGQTVGYPQ